MKIKAIIMLVLMIALSTSALAATQIKPVEVEMSVDFTDERAFKLILPGGTEKVYAWDANETHTDATFTHTIYHEYDEADWCSSYSEINTQISDLSSNFNKTIECNTAKTERSEYKRVMEIEQEQRQKYEKKYNDLFNQSQTESDTLNDELDSCESSLSSMRSAQTELSTCKKDLEKEKESKNSTMIIGALIGLGIGYMLWGKKGKGGPSEQYEMGAGGDAVHYREDEDYEQYDSPQQ